MIKPIEKQSLNDLVYEKISSLVMDGEFNRGEVVNRKNLATRLGVSQTPVNESINRLVGEGVLERRSGKGFYLREFSDKDLADYFALRAGIEAVALKITVENNSKEELDVLTHFFDNFEFPFSDEDRQHYRHQDHLFHQEILAHSKSPILTNFNNNFKFMTKCYLKGLVRPPEETFSEHQEIIEAIRNKDADLAQAKIMNHHLRSRASIISSTTRED